MIRSMPVLQVTDVARSTAFYADVLGFFAHGAWRVGRRTGLHNRAERARDDRAGQDARGRAGAAEPILAAYVYVEDADRLCAEVRARGADIVREPEDMVYGLRDFDVRDPDGHIIAFGHDLAPASVEPGLMTRRDGD